MHPSVRPMTIFRFDTCMQYSAVGIEGVGRKTQKCDFRGVLWPFSGAFSWAILRSFSEP